MSSEVAINLANRNKKQFQSSMGLRVRTTKAQFKTYTYNNKVRIAYLSFPSLNPLADIFNLILKTLRPLSDIDLVVAVLGTLALGLLVGANYTSNLAFLT